MKVLMLTDRMETGGAETHIALLSEGLTEMGAEVTILSAGGAAADNAQAHGIKQLRVPIVTHNPFRLLRLRCMLVQLVKRERYDVLHAHARIPAFLMRGLKRYGCAEIVTVHARFKNTMLLRRLCNWGTCTIAVSEDLRTYVCATYGIPAEQVHVVANGIDCNRFTPQARIHDVLRDGSKHPIRILFASRLDEDCALGAELLCRIAPALHRRSANIRISIAGGGNALARIRTLAEEINHTIGEEIVTVLGAVAEMSSLLGVQDIFVGVSRAAMEAAACGCAIVLCGNEGYFGILTAENAHRAHLTNFCCRDCRTAGTYRLQNDLLFLLESAEARKRYGDEARDLIVHRFGHERMCRETLTLYHRSLIPKGNRHIVVCGYFGCGNIGDDLILQGFLRELRDIAPNVRVTALTDRPRHQSKRFGVTCRARRNPFSVLFSFARADAFLCGGGSLLQNATSNRSLLYYLHLLRLSQRLGKCTVLYSAGIGPLQGKRARQRTTRVLRRCAYISLRDPESMRSLERWGVDRALLHAGADMAFLAPCPPTSRTTAILSENGIVQNRRYFCVILKGGAFCSNVRRMVVAAARMIAKRHILLPVFLVFDRNRDARASAVAAKEICGSMLPLREPADATAILSYAQFAVTMRLHALILSSIAAIPAVGICSDTADEKIPSLARLCAQDFLPRNTLSVGSLVECMELLLQCRDRRRPVLCDAVADLRKKAKKDLANIVAMLYNNSD